ncbi:unnamed protein product, partial [Rotaria magnacalcarata]
MNKQHWKSKIAMGKKLLIKVTMGKSPNEMGNCPFALPWLRRWSKWTQWK